VSVHEYVFATVTSTPFWKSEVASIVWDGADGDITGVRAKLASPGTGTFNLSTSAATGLLTGEEDFPEIEWYFRADDLSGKYSDDDAVLGWWGLNNTSEATQATGSMQPLYKDDAGPKGTSSALYFDGTNDRLIITTGTTTFDSDAAFTVAVVIGDVTATGSPDQIPLIATYNTLLSGTPALYGKSSRMLIRNNDAGKKQTTSKMADDDQIRILVYNGKSGGSETVEEYVNGDTSYTASSLTGTVGDFTFNAMGAVADSSSDEYLQGGISELVVFNDVLDEDQRQTVEGYLAWRWGLEGDLVDTDGNDTHPYKTSEGNPITYAYELGTDIALASTYGSVVDPTIPVTHGTRIRFYTPKRMYATGALTVELTFTAD